MAKYQVFLKKNEDDGTEKIIHLGRPMGTRHSAEVAVLAAELTIAALNISDCEAFYKRSVNPIDDIGED